MVDLFQYRQWAISEQIFRDVAPRVSKLLQAGHGMESIFKPQTIDSLMPRIQAMLEQNEAHGMDVSEPVAITRDASTGLPVVTSNNKNIALIPVIGGLTKYGGLCSYGMQHYQSFIGMANSSPTIDGIVLIIDSPGGTVDGTPEFGLTVRESKKPVGVFGDHHVASAALWVASQADVIVGNKNNPTEFGSIGTLLIAENWSKMMEAGREPQIEIIRAPQSTDKALINPVEGMTDELRAEVKQELKAITDLFIGAVKSGRGEKLDTNLPGLFSGKMFDVYTAKKHGLIDATGTLQTAVNKVAELARQRAKEEGTNTQTNKSANTMKFPKLSALLAGIFGKEKEVSMKVTSEGPQSEDTASLEAAEAKAAELEAESARLKAETESQATKIAALETNVTELQAQIASLNAEKATLTSEKAEMQKQLDEKLAGHPTTVIAGEDKTKSKFRTSADDEADKYVEAAGFQVN